MRKYTSSITLKVYIDIEAADDQEASEQLQQLCEEVIEGSTDPGTKLSDIPAEILESKLGTSIRLTESTSN